MEKEAEIQDIIQRIHSMDIVTKLDLIKRLLEDVKAEIPSPDDDRQEKNDLVNELYGTWENVEERVFEDLIESRSSSYRRVNLDE